MAKDIKCKRWTSRETKKMSWSKIDAPGVQLDSHAAGAVVEELERAILIKDRELGGAAGAWSRRGERERERDGDGVSGVQERDREERVRREGWCQWCARKRSRRETEKREIEERARLRDIDASTCERWIGRINVLARIEECCVAQCGD